MQSSPSVLIESTTPPSSISTSASPKRISRAGSNFWVDPLLRVANVPVMLRPAKVVSPRRLSSVEESLSVSKRSKPSKTYSSRGIRSFRQRLVRQRLRSIRQRAKSPCQRPTGQFANVRYLVLTEKKLVIDVCFGENRLLNTKVRWLPKVLQLPHQFGDKALRCKLT